ncbi:VOC family protein [Ilumatobacter sp.]|uniref:VOC family protein n=1 Tax=Ilumatobacter sp. TaxID=1967498 RepID=UPI003B5296DF
MIGPPVQIAYAVDDVDAAASRWVADGIGPFFVIDHVELSWARIRGRRAEFDHSSAYARWGGVMVELIHQHDGGVDPVVPVAGIHHVAHFVDDLADAARALVEGGHPEVLAAETTGGTTFAFHDSIAEHGHLTEIYERSDALARFYAMVRDAADGWSGDAPIRRL